MKVRGLKSDVWLQHKEGDIVDVDKDLSFYIKEGVVEELVVGLDVDTKKVRAVQLRVADVHHKVTTT